jgi:hypothetical protein
MLTRENMIDPGWCEKVDSEISSAYTLLYASAGGDALVFESGEYHVVSADSVTAISAALDRVPAEKRPTLNEKLLAWYEKNMPNHRFLLACFNQSKLTHARPFGYWYTPRPELKDVLVVPMLDAHDGDPPTDGPVGRDHTVYFGLQPARSARSWIYWDKFNWSEDLDPEGWYGLPGYVGEREIRGEYPNGDLVLSEDHVYLKESEDRGSEIPEGVFARV